MSNAARVLSVWGALAFVAGALVIPGLACMDVGSADAEQCAVSSFLRFGATSLVGAAAALIGIWLLPRRPYVAAGCMLAAASIGLVLLIAYGYFVSSLRVLWQIAVAVSSVAAALALALGVRGQDSAGPRQSAAKNPVLAAVLSVLIIGLGHWYLGRWRRALAWEGGLFALAIAFTAMNLPDSALSTVGLALLVASGADAWRIATQMNTQRQATESRRTA